MKQPLRERVQWEWEGWRYLRRGLHMNGRRALWTWLWMGKKYFVDNPKEEA